MRLCGHIGCSLFKAKSETTVDEFLLWWAWFDEQWVEHTKEDWYNAYLMWEVFETPFRVWGKSSGKKPEDFLLKFTVGESRDSAQPDQKELERRAKESKAVWTGFLGAIKETKDKERRQQEAVERAKKAAGDLPPSTNAELRQKRGSRAPGSKPDGERQPVPKRDGQRRG